MISAIQHHARRRSAGGKKVGKYSSIFAFYAARRVDRQTALRMEERAGHFDGTKGWLQTLLGSKLPTKGVEVPFHTG
jgi:hypothetical protein